VPVRGLRVVEARVMPGAAIPAVVVPFGGPDTVWMWWREAHRCRGDPALVVELDQDDRVVIR